MFKRNENGDWKDKDGGTLNEYLKEYDLGMCTIKEHLANSDSFILKTPYDKVLKFDVKEERMRRQVELNKANQERAFERTQKGIQGFVK